ncbi:MAG: hypothetical protein BWY71_02368 [Planctomycetes bacterium ADurb.Bin412]|nr:MAG: hypothetical protein BWY71_02368 [Planctomycetes bacterium ADurb.Bin412]
MYSCIGISQAIPHLLDTFGRSAKGDRPPVPEIWGDSLRKIRFHQQQTSPFHRIQIQPIPELHQDILLQPGRLLDLPRQHRILLPQSGYVFLVELVPLPSSRPLPARQKQLGIHQHRRIQRRIFHPLPLRQQPSRPDQQLQCPSIVPSQIRTDRLQQQMVRRFIFTNSALRYRRLNPVHLPPLNQAANFLTHGCEVFCCNRRKLHSKSKIYNSL